jgi:hypothetical protein
LGQGQAFLLMPFLKRGSTVSSIFLIDLENIRSRQIFYIGQFTFWESDPKTIIRLEKFLTD